MGEQEPDDVAVLLGHGPVDHEDRLELLADRQVEECVERVDPLLGGDVGDRTADQLPVLVGGHRRDHQPGPVEHELTLGQVERGPQHRPPAGDR